MTALAFWFRLSLAWETGQVTVEAAPLVLTQDVVEYIPCLVTYDGQERTAEFESRVEASLEYAR